MVMTFSAPAPAKRQKSGTAHAFAVPLTESAIGKIGLSSAETIELAKLIISEYSLSSMNELKYVDREIYDAVIAFGLEGNVFPAQDNCTQSEKERERTYMMICIECFRLGTAKPFIRDNWGYVPKLRKGMERIASCDKALFDKCWESMIQSGVITLHDKKTKASLEPDVSKLESGPLKNAMLRALEEQRKVNEFWASRFGAPRL